MADEAGASEGRSLVSGLLQPHPLTSVMQMAITFCSLCIAAVAIAFIVKAASEERNARLVEIGVGVLKVYPSKEDPVAAARKWALDLIDANGGGVKFSREARQQLLQKPLETGWYGIADGYFGSGILHPHPR